MLHLSNRVYVMHHAQMVAELTGAQINEQAVLACFFRDENQTAPARQAAPHVADAIVT